MRSILFVATTLALIALRRATPQIRYLIACAGLALMSAAPLVTVTAYLRESRVSADTNHATSMAPPSPAPPSFPNDGEITPVNHRSKTALERQLPVVVLICTYLVLLVTMVYGPIAAWLVELFPPRIRYTSLSLPYHIGNGWFGGFLPVTSFAIVASTGNIYSGLWYPVIVAALTAAIGALLLRETHEEHVRR